jgi:PTS system cellobiose-specific IIA component
MDENVQNEKETEINETAMQIIIHAGDARLHVVGAISAMGDNRFDEARQQITLAQEKLKSAHVLHTRAIQDEARGVYAPHSLLFTHAQDTLMTIKSELLLAENLLGVFEKLNQRIDGLDSNGKK